MHQEPLSADSAPTPFGAAAGNVGRALCAAVSALVRLDDRLAAAPGVVRAGWLNHMLLEEAAASARLDAIVVDADELRLHAVGALDADEDRAIDGADRIELAAGILRVLCAVSARHPRHLFTANRLTATARLRLKGRPREIRADPRLPEFLVEVPDPQAARSALPRALSPDAMAAWRRMPPPVAAADFLVRWTETGCAAAVGGFIGRALVPPLFVRLGATSRPILFPSVGYLGHAWEYRPDRMAREEWAAVGWLGACRRAAERGLLLHGRIVQAHARLHAALKPSRSTGRGGAVADCLTATPAVTGRTLARQTGLSDVASRDLLHRALQAGALHELTGRAAFRVYGALP